MSYAQAHASISILAHLLGPLLTAAGALIR
jgi:hypothetical protein